MSLPGWAGAAVALLAVGWGPSWRWARLVVTAAHELGHALAALCCGGTVRRVVLRFDTAGETHWEAPAGFGRVRRAVVAAAGYPAPGVAGAAGAVAVHHGAGRWWLWVCAAAAAAVVVVWVRNPWGLFSGVVVAAGCAAAARVDGPAGAAVGAAVAVTLAAGGLRSGWEHLSGREAGSRTASDSGTVRAAFGFMVPATAVSVWFLVCCAMAALLCAAGLGWGLGDWPERVAGLLRAAES